MALSEYRWSSPHSWADMSAALRARRSAQLRTANSADQGALHGLRAADTAGTSTASKAIKCDTSTPHQVQDGCLQLREHPVELQRSRSSSTVSYSDDDDFEDVSPAATPQAIATTAQEVVWSEDSNRRVELPPPHMVVTEEHIQLFRQQSQAQHAAHASTAEELRAQLRVHQESMAAMQVQLQALQAHIATAAVPDNPPVTTRLARVAMRVTQEMLLANHNATGQQRQLPSPPSPYSLSPSGTKFEAFLSHNWVRRRTSMCMTCCSDLDLH